MFSRATYFSRVALATAVVVLAPLAGAPDPSERTSSRLSVDTLPAGVIVHFRDDGVRVARRSPIAVSAPAEVAAGSRLRIKGSLATGAVGRPVVLKERVSRTDWRVLAQERTTRSGTFSFGIRARTAAALVFRVTAQPTGRLPRLTTGTIRVRVRPPGHATKPRPTMEVPVGEWDPAELPPPGEVAKGSATDWSFLFGASSSRWDPCTVIRWTYNPDGAYRGSLKDMKRALARIAGRTGLHFRYVGPTTYVEGSGAAFPEAADLAVAWTTARHHRMLAGSVVGLGGGRAVPLTGKDVTHRMTQGYLLLDVKGRLRRGFDVRGEPTWGQVMQHEALHVLGLGHAETRQQLMHGELSGANHGFGAGDLAGMQRIGASQGCL